MPAPQVSASLPSFPIPSHLSSKGLHFLHSNVRSLLPKIPEVQQLLLRTKTAVFAASETWLDPSIGNGEIQIPGFNVIRQDRNRNGGGVALYIHENIAFNPRPDLAVDGMESVWVELLLPKSKGILVGVMYRPPNDSNFLSNLELSLSKISEGSEFYILGDMNIDFSRTSSMLNRYREILDDAGCEQVVSEPTRITPTSASIIDHIVTNMGEMIPTRGVMVGGFSDHLITYCTRRMSRQVFSGSLFRRARSLKNYSKEVLVNELSKIDWSAVLRSDDVNFCLAEFRKLFMSAVDKVAPFREIRVKKRSNPWMNAHILAGIRKRDGLFSRFRKDRNNSDVYRDYCRVRNAVQSRQKRHFLDVV